MLKDRKGVLFDLDGTLIDSMWIWKDIDQIYLKRHGYAVPEDLQRNVEGKGFTETAQYFKTRFSLTDNIETIKDDWNQLAYQFYSTKVQLKSGVLKFLEYLKTKDIPLGIATSNSIELTNATLKANHIRDYFQTVCTSCDVSKGKPSPDIYLKAAGDIGVSPEECLVFEDVPMGILAGRHAGMKVCAVEDEQAKDQMYTIKELAHYYIKDYEQVLLNTYEVCQYE